MLHETAHRAIGANETNSLALQALQEESLKIRTEFEFVTAKIC